VVLDWFLQRERPGSPGGHRDLLLVLNRRRLSASACEGRGPDRARACPPEESKDSRALQAGAVKRARFQHEEQHTTHRLLPATRSGIKRS